MTPIEKAVRLHPGPDEFRDVLEAHLLHGRIISTDKVFLMVRPVYADWECQRMLAPWEYAEDGDCWYCWDLAGDLSSLREIPTSWLQSRPWVAFHCEGRRRVTRASRLLNIG